MAVADVNPYVEIGRTRVLETIKSDSRALKALAYLSGRQGLAEHDVLDLVDRLLTRRQTLAGRLEAEAERDDRRMADRIDEIIARLKQDRAEAGMNEYALDYSTAPPGDDEIAALDRIKTYFKVRIALSAKERALLGLTRKATPESAAVGAFAAEIKARVGKSCEGAIVDLLSPFVEQLIDEKAVARCRAAYERRRRIAGSERPKSAF
jgi:hypothetical protein